MSNKLFFHYLIFQGSLRHLMILNLRIIKQKNPLLRLRRNKKPIFLIKIVKIFKMQFLNFLSKKSLVVIHYFTSFYTFIELKTYLSLHNESHVTAVVQFKISFNASSQCAAKKGQIDCATHSPMKVKFCTVILSISFVIFFSSFLLSSTTASSKLVAF